MGRRPEWCKRAECPFFRHGNCTLDNSLIDGFPTLRTRREERKKLKKSTPQEIKSKCQREDLDYF